MAAQISHFEQLLNEQYMIAQSFRAKEEEMGAHKMEMEATKLSLENCHLELKALRKENAEILGENEQYQLLLDKQREQEMKLKKQLNEHQKEAESLRIKYKDMAQKLQRETVETRQQLQAAQNVAHGLSDQLKEIENYQLKEIDSEWISI